jgi:hypothetical protein
MESIVTGHPVKTREDIRTLKIPSDRTGKTQGGLGINLELGKDVNLDVIEAAIAALEKYRRYFSSEKRVDTENRLR